MGFRSWLCKQLLGSDPRERLERLEAQADVMSSEIASLVLLTQAISDVIPPVEWTEGVTNAVVNMDKALTNFKSTLQSHQECIQHLMVDQDPDVLVTEWGMIRNTKDSN